MIALVVGFVLSCCAGLIWLFGEVERADASRDPVKLEVFAIGLMGAAALIAFGVALHLSYEQPDPPNYVPILVRVPLQAEIP